MEEVPGPAGTTVTLLTFRGGHQIEVYETIEEIMQLAHLRRGPVPTSGARCTKASSPARAYCYNPQGPDRRSTFA
jgi:hypothetical protein